MYYVYAKGLYGLVLLSKHGTMEKAKKRCKNFAEKNTSVAYVFNQEYKYGHQKPIYVWEATYK